MRGPIGLLIALSFLAVPGVHGAIYFTDQVTAATATPGCASFVPTYAATLVEPTGEEAGKVVPAFAAGGLGCPATIVWTADRAFAFSGDSTARLFIGCDTAGVLQGVQVDWRHNGETITEGNAVTYLTNPPTCTGPASVTEILVPLGDDDIDVQVGDTIEADVIIFEYLPNEPYNQEAHVANRHVKVNSTAFPSGILNGGIPTAGGAPVEGNGTGNESAVRENLTGSSPAVEHRFATPTNATYELAWQTDRADVLVDVQVNSTAGSALITIRDAANQTVFQEEVTSNATLHEAISGATSGNWSITIAYSNFTGELKLALSSEAAEGADSSESSTSTTKASSTNDDNRTGSFPLRNEEQTPGLGPVALLVLVAVAGIAARRRLR